MVEGGVTSDFEKEGEEAAVIESSQLSLET